MTNVVLLEPPKDDTADNLRAGAKAILESALEFAGDDIGGYCILVFEKDGGAHTGMNYARLPVRDTLFAHFVKDVVIGHVNRELARQDREDGACGA